MQENIKNLSSRYRQYYMYIEPVISDPVVRGYFSFVATLLLVSFLIIFALSPTMNVILGLRKQISDQKQTINALDTKVALLVQAQESYNKIQAYLPLLDQALPENPAPQTVITDVHKVASSAGVILTAFQIQSAPVSKDLPLTDNPVGVPVLKMTFSVTGSIQQVRQFFALIEQQVRYIRIDRFTLIPNKENSGFSADAIGVAYFFHL